MKVYQYLSSEYAAFPCTGRIFRKSDGCDITPRCRQDIEYLNTLELQDVDIVIPPQDPLTLVISVVLSLAVTLLTKPTIPNAANRNIPESSPNNGLSARTNEARIGARRPSIYGTVNSVPDLIARPYKVFNDAGLEVEFNYMFVSEGTITASIYKEASTQIKDINGSSIELYHPGTSPKNGVPAVTVGNAIKEPFISARKSESVTGQTLRPPNKITATDNIKFISPNRVLFESADDLLDKFEVGETAILSDSIIGGVEFSRVGGRIQGSSIKFEETTLADLPFIFSVGNQIHAPNQAGSIVTITSIIEGETATGDDLTVGGGGGEPDPNQPTTPHVIIYISPSLTPFSPEQIQSGNEESGFTYTDTPLFLYIGEVLTNLGLPSVITAISDSEIILGNATWPENIESSFKNRSLSVEGPRWTDYFILDDANLQGVIVNLSCTNGAYKDDGNEQVRSIVDCVLGITRVDINDNPISNESLHTITLKGSSVVRDSVNKTLRAAANGRCRIRMHRSSFKDTDFEGQVVDEVKFKDLYSFKAITEHDIADNTRIRTATTATEGALSLKSRKLIIADATRNLPRYNGKTFTSALYPTKSAADILVAVSLDPAIGRRSLDELNVPQIYDTVKQINTYFRNDSAADFSYTLDNSNLTFEDTFSMIAQSIFSRGYRRSTKHNLSFEKREETSTLLFCHRNKIPNTETRRVEFGIRKDADGASCKYIDADGIERTVSVPKDSLFNAIEVPLLGLNVFQATKHAWREWNKAQYQNLFTQFDATSEAALCVLGQRILVADNTASDTYDGEVLDQDGLSLVLSQDVPESGWIHLQLPKTEVQVVKYIRQSPFNITLSNPTQTVLSTHPQNYARATYLITDKADDQQAFLLLERSGDKTYTMKLGNYDSRFYKEDQTKL